MDVEYFRRRGIHRWRARLTSVARCGLLPLLCGCQFAPSPFDQSARNAGANFAAAATTLAYAHQNRIPMAYAEASFVAFQSELAGMASSLPREQGAPEARTVRRLLALYRRAEAAVMHPCFDRSCPWRTQVRAMEQASVAFLKAGGG